ncbi:MAG: flippase, partial [Candidatus Komeilibacteria bacterium]|nr:flippase [Candidatus Komeilibacteria bacterium]
MSNLVKNTSYFSLALVIQKVISFIFFSYLAARLGATSLGYYNYAISFAAMFSILVDWGLANLLTRDIAQDKTRAQNYFSRALGLKIIWSLITYGLVIAIIFIISDSALTRELVIMTGVLMLLDSFTLIFYSVWRGFQNLAYESFATICFQVIYAASGFILLQLTSDLKIIMLALFGASLFNFIYSSCLLRFKGHILLKPIFAWPALKSLYLLALPFGLAGIFSKIYAYTDVILVNQFLGPTQTGFYSLAYKLTFTLQFIPLALIAGLYPALALYLKKEKEILEDIYFSSIKYLLILSLLASALIFTFGHNVIEAIYGQKFLPSTPILIILMLSLPFLFVNFTFGSLLNASGRALRQTWHIGWTAAVNIILNIIFIPLFGIMGAAATSLFCTILLFSLNGLVARRIISLSKPHLKQIGRLIILTLIIILLNQFVPSHYSWIIKALIFVLLYLFGLFACQIIRWQEITN